jgi:hypothetical protein
VFALNAAKGNARGSLEEVKALTEEMQLKNLKANLGNMDQLMNKSPVLSYVQA